MLRLKMLVGLAGIFSVLAVSATPAFAEFEAKGQWKVPFKVVKSGEFVDEGSTVKCPEKEIEGTVSVQSKGVINEHEKGSKQVQVKRGPHLNIKVLKWGGHCEATIAGEKLSAKVTPCELQVRLAPGGKTSATGGSVTTCIIEAGPCKITVPEGKETTAEKDEGSNVGLKAVTLEDKGTTNLFAKNNTVGVTTEVAKGTLCTLKSNSTSELKGLEGEAEGITAL
jgi:hypothetical protein